MEDSNVKAKATPTKEDLAIGLSHAWIKREPADMPAGATHEDEDGKPFEAFSCTRCDAKGRRYNFQWPPVFAPDSKIQGACPKSPLKPAAAAPVSPSSPSSSSSSARQARTPLAIPEQVMLPTASIEPDPDNPRRHRAGERTTLDLEQSIQANGILHPLLVHPITPQKYRLIAGERRWRAATELKLERVPCRIYEKLDPIRHKELQLIENLQREDLTELEEAQAYAALRDGGAESKSKWTVEAIAGLVHKSIPHVYNRLALLKAPKEILKRVEEGVLSPNAVPAILQLPDPKDRAALLEDLSVEPMTLQDIKDHVKSRCVSLRRAVFATDSAPDCATCPKMSANIPGALAGADGLVKLGEAMCTDLRCFREKTARALPGIEKDLLRTQGLTLRELPDGRTLDDSFHIKLFTQSATRPTQVSQLRKLLKKDVSAKKLEACLKNECPGKCFGMITAVGENYNGAYAEVGWGCTKRVRFDEWKSGSGRSKDGKPAQQRRSRPNSWEKRQEAEKRAQIAATIKLRIAAAAVIPALRERLQDKSWKIDDKAAAQILAELSDERSTMFCTLEFSPETILFLLSDKPVEARKKLKARYLLGRDADGEWIKTLRTLPVGRSLFLMHASNVLHDGLEPPDAKDDLGVYGADSSLEGLYEFAKRHGFIKAIWQAEAKAAAEAKARARIEAEQAAGDVIHAIHPKSSSKSKSGRKST